MGSLRAGDGAVVTTKGPEGKLRELSELGG